MTGDAFLRKYCFFGAVIIFLCVLGTTGLPVAHFHFDGVAIRDTGTMLPYLATRPNPAVSIIAPVFAHVEGPLQYILLNLYCCLVGDLLPLNPSTMQIPNTIFAFMAAIFCWVVGRRMSSARLAYCSVTALVMGPWLAYTIRLPWYFNTLSCLLHFSTMCWFASFMTCPNSRFYRVAAPASLALYLMIGLDWPCFVLCLILFVLLSRQLDHFTDNPYDILPVLTVAVVVIWSSVYVMKFGAAAFLRTPLIYPFPTFVEYVESNSWLRVWNNTVLPWGPQLLLASAGGAIYLLRERKRLSSDLVRRGFFDTMCFWFLFAGAAIFASSGSPTYLYVLAMPSAILSGLVLSKMRLLLLVPCVMVMVIFQLYFLTDKHFVFPEDKKLRVLAAACYLIEERPDLLTGKRTPVVVGHDAAAVSHYMRPKTQSVLLGEDFLAQLDSMRKNCSVSEAATVVDFLGSPTTIENPWFILDSEILSEGRVTKDAWLGILQEPSTHWIAQFREPTGEVIYIGEFCAGLNQSANDAPSMDVARLSEEYEKKYDRISFLKRNVEYLLHY